MPDIIVDTREHADVIAPIIEYFDNNGIVHFHKKLDVGDYQLPGNPYLVVDRKHDLNELCGNVVQDHARFRREMERAKDNNVKLIVLIEHGNGIASIEDVRNWVNPRLKISPKAITGQQLARTMETQEIKYGIKYMFCERDESGRKIMEILRNG